VNWITFRAASAIQERFRKQLAADYSAGPGRAEVQAMLADLEAISLEVLGDEEA
jgi:hypothetical protein